MCIRYRKIDLVLNANLSHNIQGVQPRQINPVIFNRHLAIGNLSPGDEYQRSRGVTGRAYVREGVREEVLNKDAPGSKIEDGKAQR